MFFQKKREKLGERKNEGAILKFVNISSDAISSNGLHEVSSASTSKSIRKLRKKQRLAKLVIMKKQMLRAI